MKKVHRVFSGARLFLFTGMIMGLALQGCIKDKYDFNKLSTKAHITHQWDLPVVYGSMKMGNMVEPNDTIVFDDNGAVKIVYRKDSIFSLTASDVMQIDDQAPDSNDIALGPFRLYDFYGRKDIANTTGTYPLDPFAKFTRAVFAGGMVSVTVTNNLSTDITSLTLRFHNTGDNSIIGSDLVFTNLRARDSVTQSMDLAGLDVTNRWSVEVVSITPATASVPDGLTVSILSSDVKAFSGNAVLPDQVFYADTGNYELEEDTIQLTSMEIKTGAFAIKTESPLSEPIEFAMIFPTGRRFADTLKYHFVNNGGTDIDTLRLDSTLFDLATVPSRPYNILPYMYRVALRSTGQAVDFNVAQLLHFRYQLANLKFQYARGYLGKQEYVFDEDTIDVGLDDLFSRIKGTFSLTNPQVRLLYTNGFGIPNEITTNVTGKTKSGDEQALNAPPMRLLYPADRTEPPVKGDLAFTRDNTDIVPLIDLHPSYIIYGGKAVINPDGFQGWDNFVTDQSSILLSLEVEVPLEFRMQDLQLQDTIDNPFYEENNSDTTDLNLRDFDYIRLRLQADNGFPVGMSFRIYIYEKETNTVVDSILFGQIIKAAPVDDGGRVTGVTSSVQSVEINNTQINELMDTPDLIVAGVFNSSDGGTKSVKIYTDYTFDFKLGVQTKFDYEFDLGDAGKMNNF